MALRLPLCLFNRHVPNRHRVKWDGFNFVAACRYCKRPIRKEEHSAWRRDWMPEESAHSTPVMPPLGAKPMHDERRPDSGQE